MFVDLPQDDYDSTTQRIRTEGYTSLLSFIRTTLNYHQNICTITTPDGFIETMRYVGGIETFQEAVGQVNKQKFWSGTISWDRVIY